MSLGMSEHDYMPRLLMLVMGYAASTSTLLAQGCPSYTPFFFYYFFPLKPKRLLLSVPGRRRAGSVRVSSCQCSGDDDAPGVENNSYHSPVEAL